MAIAHDSRGFAPAEANVREAGLRAYEAGQAPPLQRLGLWIAEARIVARGGLGILLDACVAFAAGPSFAAGVIDALARDYPRFAVKASVGGLHGAGTGALHGLSARRRDPGTALVTEIIDASTKKMFPG